jgi:hypothetical protein
MQKNINLAMIDAYRQYQGSSSMNPGIITGVPSHFAAHEAGYGSQYETIVAATIAAILFPGAISQVRHLPLLFRGGMTASQAGYFYGPSLLGVPTFGGIALGLLLDRIKSRGQDGKLGVSTPSVPPRTPRGTKPSRPTRSGSSSKPFWSNGKPKCKKGFRYDFKRKLCVKIK